MAGRYAFMAEGGQEGLLQALGRIAREPVPDLRQEGVPADVAAVIEKSMAKTASERYQSALAMGRALQAAQRSTGQSATPITVPGEPPTGDSGAEAAGTQVFSAAGWGTTPPPGWEAGGQYAASEAQWAAPAGWQTSQPYSQGYTQQPTPQPFTPYPTPQPFAAQPSGTYPPQFAPQPTWQGGGPPPSSGGTSRGLIIAIIVAALVLVGGGVAGILAVTSGGDDPTAPPETEDPTQPPESEDPTRPPETEDPTQPSNDPTEQPPGDPVALSIGDVAEGSIDEAAPSAFYTFSGDPGQTITILVDSTQIDPLVRLSAGGEEVADDDDGGPGLNTRLVYVLESAEEHTIEVSSFGGDDIGGFTLQLLDGEQGQTDGTTTEPPVTPTVMNALDTFTDTGTITESAPSTFFTLTVASGTRVVINVNRAEGSTLDPLVIFRDGDGNELGRDDDGGGFPNARLEVTLPGTGEYEIEVTRFGTTSTGDFEITTQIFA